MVTKFCMVAPKNFGPSLWNLHHVTPFGTQNFEVVHVVLENLCTPVLNYYLLGYILNHTIYKDFLGGLCLIF